MLVYSDVPCLPTCSTWSWLLFSVYLYWSKSKTQFATTGSSLTLRNFFKCMYQTEKWWTKDTLNFSLTITTLQVIVQVAPAFCICTSSHRLLKYTLHSKSPHTTYFSVLFKYVRLKKRSIITYCTLPLKFLR